MKSQLLENSRINIMHIVFSLDTGGAERMVYELAKRLDKGNFDCSVCSLTGEGVFSNRLRKAGINVFCINKSKGVDFSLFLKLVKIFKKERIDIVHTHDSSTILYGTIAAKLAGVPCVINTEHGGIYFETPRKKIISRFLWRLNNRVVCVSNSIKNDLNQMGLLNSKAEVIPNGIGLDKFDIEVDIKQKRKELGLSSSDFVICSVGRLSKEKNQKMLIDSAEYILEEIPNAKFIIVGDGPLKENLQYLVHSKGLEKYVIFLGEREDVPEILKISDCFVNCSNYESFGLAIVEAMASGIPVVATDSGGVGEIIRNDEIGTLIFRNDTKGLIEAVVRLKKGKEFLQGLIQKGKEYAQTHYVLNRMVDKYNNLYLGLMDGRDV